MNSSVILKQSRGTTCIITNVYNMSYPNPRLIVILVMAVCFSWLVGVITKSISVGIVFFAFCVAYMMYQSLNKYDDEEK